uniref:Uncharacterized protein n=1 Tax=Stegastes partitus TaxID=144197 RepID=A0A3B4ZDI1_9TELE
MLWSPRLSLSNFHVKLTAKGLFRNLQLLSGCRKNTVVFHADFSMSRKKPAERGSVLIHEETVLRLFSAVTSEMFRQFLNILLKRCVSVGVCHVFVV